jgi:dTDP-4-amino-4,6-dideoxygalactose transaminase
MLVSDNEDYIKRARFLSTQARDPAPHYQHSQIGYNCRLSNLLAALGRGQLEHLDEKAARRRAINEFYRNALREIPGIEFMPEAPWKIQLLAYCHFNYSQGFWCGSGAGAAGFGERKHRISPHLASGS